MIEILQVNLSVIKRNVVFCMLITDWCLQARSMSSSSQDEGDQY